NFVVARTGSRTRVELGRVNTTHRFNDQCEVDKGYEHHIELLEAREDATETFQSAEQPLDLVAPPVHDAVVFPGLDAVGLRWYDGCEPEVKRKLASFVVAIRPIHDQVDRAASRAQAV